MPAYNASLFINASIKSFVNQTYPNKELIIVDDGSTDDLFNKVESALQSHSNIKYIRQKNSGVSAARNNAIRETNGEWIAFLDADDIWYEGKLETQWKEMTGFNWSHTDSHYFGAGYEHQPKRSDLSEMCEGDVFLSLLQENFITTSSVLIRKDILVNAGQFDESLEALEDWRLWLSIAAKHPLKYVPKALLDYRVHAASTSRKARKMLPLHLEVIDKALSTVDAEDKKRLKKHAYSSAYTIMSYVAEYSGDQMFSIRCAFNAWLLDSFSLKKIKRIISSCIALRPF